MRVLDTALVPVEDVVSLGGDGSTARVGGAGVTQTGVAVGISQAGLQKLDLGSIEAIEHPALVDDLGKGDENVLAMVRHVVIKFTVETIGEHKRLQGAIRLGGVQGGTATVQVDGNLRLLQHTNILGEDKSDGSEEGGGVRSTLGKSGVMVGKSTAELVQALDTVAGNHIVGQRLQRSNDVIASGRLVDGLSAPVLSENIVEHNGEASSEVTESGGAIGGESKSPVSNTATVDTVVEVQRVGSVLASAEGAIGTVVSGIALATKGDVLIPQLVDVAIVVGSDFLDGVAHTMSRAVAGARGSLTGRALISLETLASSRSTVAKTLVGALHVVMSGVGKLVATRVHHLRELFAGSVRVHLTVHHNSGGRASQHSRRSIQITLGGIDVSKPKLTHSLRAIIGHPVAIAHAHIVVAAHTMRAASIGALSIGKAEDASSEENSGSDFVKHLY